MRAGQGFTHTAGLEAAADGVLALSWTLVDGLAGAVASGSSTPQAGAISVDIALSSGNNTLPGAALFGSRELAWTYGTQQGLYRYNLEGSIPFGVSPEGVRVKLGLEVSGELSDTDIPLLKAYLVFRDLVGSAALSAITEDLKMLQVADAIEASAALLILPTMQVRLAQKESSGTNQFTRAKIDWEQLAASLQSTVDEGLGAVDATLAATSNGISLLQVATPALELFPGA